MLLGLNKVRPKVISPAIKAGLGDRYTRHELASIERFGTLAELREGSVFLTEGSLGRQAVIIIDGTAAVSRSGEIIATVGPGDVVGERSLLLNQPRNASLIATSALSIAVFTRPEFDSLRYACPRFDARMADLLDQRTA